jgi:CheY-like chemotaxis protein
VENTRNIHERDAGGLESGRWLPESVQRMPYVEDHPTPNRILVVDDDKGVREAMAGVISDFGYDVAVAANGDEALILLQDSTFGLVFTDFHMPGMDGWRLAEHIKKDSAAIVVLVTASDRRSVEERLPDSCVDSVLFKPFHAEELLSVVAHAFGITT